MIVSFRIWDLTYSRPFKQISSDGCSRYSPTLVKLDLNKFTKATAIQTKITNYCINFLSKLTEWLVLRMLSPLHKNIQWWWSSEDISSFKAWMDQPPIIIDHRNDYKVGMLRVKDHNSLDMRDVRHYSFIFYGACYKPNASRKINDFVKVLKLICLSSV